MKRLIEKQVCTADYTTPSARTMHKKTHLISKVKPIRIIHIFAPEIIKINAESFREVVQRLTGKPTEDNMAKKSNKRMDVGGCMRIKGEEEIWRGSNSSGGFSAEIDGFMQDIFNQFPIVEEY
ncbi:VQ motif-containing protein 25-like [Henckelia pumila]|uniref:VQ motif-containing protein 25-like n=1 Tax=Henckelia pumila TaxID=405737 RepID=UPI003C6E894F